MLEKVPKYVVVEIIGNSPKEKEACDEQEGQDIVFGKDWSAVVLTRFGRRHCVSHPMCSLLNEGDRDHPSDHDLVGRLDRLQEPRTQPWGFWVAGALDMLKKAHLIDVRANREFLLTKTAHMVGGFGKLPKSPPDVLHSFFAPAALSFYREEGINRVDSEMAISLQARERLEGFAWFMGK